MVMDEDDHDHHLDEFWESTSHASSLQDYRMIKNHQQQRNSDSEHDIPDGDPPLLSSPSAASSLGAFSNAVSPLRREFSRTTLHDEASDSVSSPSETRLALARRLSHLAQQLAGRDEEVDELALTAQVDQMERTILARTGSKSPPRSTTRRRRPASFGGWRTQSGLDDLSGSRGLPSSHPSEMPVSFTTKDSIHEAADEEDQKKSLTLRQANKIIAEADKLNEELATIVANLEARQEESDHIHSLLIERAERAAQRIIFLQTRIAHLEEELGENDDELQNLRICLKAVEIQMPPHPDPAIQRCIAGFKEDYQRLRRKRASRESWGSGAE